MITAQEIKTKAARKYVEYLKSLVVNSSIFPLDIPANKTYNKSSMEEFRREINEVLKDSKERKGFGYSLEYQTVRTKSLGLQDLPTRIFFENDQDYIRYLSKVDEVNAFKENYQNIVRHFPQLKTWVEMNPLKVIAHATDWESLIKVCQYFQQTPQPNLYIRELPISVHTKFIEKNKGIIRALLLELISAHCDIQHNNFEKCFHLKAYEAQIHFRILDPHLSTQCFLGISELAIPLSQFRELELPIKRIIIVENKTSFYTTLTLPNMSNTLALFGSGYKIAELKDINWFKDIELIYWGDLDAQGFEILSQFRGYFPQTQSFLMDQSTFDLFFEGDLGTLSVANSTLNLDEPESKLYQDLKENNYRLEQEKIPFSYVNQRIKELLY